LEENVRYFVIALVVVIVNIVAIAGVYFYVDHKISKNGIEILQTEQQIDRFGSFGQEVENTYAEKRLIADRLAAIQKLEQSKGQGAQLLVGLSEAIPKTVWLTDAKKTNKTLKLTGYAVSNEGVAAFMDALQKKRLFSQITLKQVQAASIKNDRVYKFELACLLGGSM
jgi:Tfp pilus assembly protein PilN